MTRTSSRRFDGNESSHVIGDHLGELPLPSAVARAIRADHEAETRGALLQVRELGRLRDVLAAADIDFLAFKGPVLAVLTTGRIDARGFGDLDIFVEPRRAARAFEALTDSGWRPTPVFPDPGQPWAWRHLLRNHYEMAFVGDHSRVDLHWWLDPTRRALPDFTTAWSRRDVVSLLGGTLATLGIRDTFAHTCSHAGKDRWRWLRSLVDVHRLASAPALWQPDPPRLRRVDFMTLAVTSECMGWPAVVPPAVRSTAAQHQSAVRSAPIGLRAECLCPN